MKHTSPTNTLELLLDVAESTSNEMGCAAKGQNGTAVLFWVFIWIATLPDRKKEISDQAAADQNNNKKEAWGGCDWLTTPAQRIVSTRQAETTKTHRRSSIHQ